MCVIQASSLSLKIANHIQTNEFRLDNAYYNYGYNCPVPPNGGLQCIDGACNTGQGQESKHRLESEPVGVEGAYSQVDGVISIVSTGPCNSDSNNLE